jgi:hypothetical protein
MEASGLKIREAHTNILNTKHELVLSGLKQE